MAARVRVGLLLFLFFQALYALTSSGWVFRVPDELETYFQIEHLVDEGDISVPQTLELPGKPFFGKRGVDGRLWAPYGPLAAPLSLGHHLLGRAVAAVVGLDDPGMRRLVVSGLTSLATATAAALAVLAFHRAALALGAPPRRALVLSLLLGGATVLWPYGTSLYAEAYVAALFMWATALLLEGRTGTRPPVVAAVLIATAVLVKATSVVVTPAFLVAILLDRQPRERRLNAALVVGSAVAVALVLHMSWNLRRFGVSTDLGYDWSETVKGAPRPFALDELPRGLFVLLATPGKSLFLWAPALLLAVTRARELARTEPGVAAGIGVAFATSLLFFGSYMFVEGGYAHGPRHLVPIVPLLLLPAAAPAASEPRRVTVLVCAAVGLVVSLGAASVSYLEDQAMGEDRTRLSYYERITPAPGRPWNRYRVAYVPFVATLRSRSFVSTTNTPGTGLDFFPLHLVRVRHSAIPGATALPAWLPWALSLPWLVLLLGSGAMMVTMPKSENEGCAPPSPSLDGPPKSPSP